MGRPWRLKPHGPVIAELQLPLEGFRVADPDRGLLKRRRRASSLLLGSCTSVGVTRTSTSSNAAATAVLTSAS